MDIFKLTLKFCWNIVSTFLCVQTCRMFADACSVSTIWLLAGLSGLGKFLFWEILHKFQSTKCRLFVIKCTDLKIQCWSMFFCPELNKNCAEKVETMLRKKIPNFLKFLPKKSQCTKSTVQPLSNFPQLPVNLNLRTARLLTPASPSDHPTEHTYTTHGAFYSPSLTWAACF